MPVRTFGWVIFLIMSSGISAYLRQIKGYFTMPYDYVSDNNLADDLWTIRAF